MESGVRVSIGDVDQNGIVHKNMAIKVSVFFKAHDHEYNCVFKGEEMVRKASEWLFLNTEGEFNYGEVGTKWLTKLIEFQELK